MRIRVCLLSFFFFVSMIFRLEALEWPQDFCAYDLGMDYEFRYSTSVWKNGERLTLFRRIGGKEYYQDLRLNDLELQPDGFYELKAFGSTLVSMFGARYFFFHDVTHPEYSVFTTVVDYDSYYDNNRLVFMNTDILGRRSIGISKIQVPNVLEEAGRGGRVRYDTTDMERYYARGLDGWVIANPYGKPWATRKNPVGMSIDITFNRVISQNKGYIEKGSNYLIVLNGYANPLKRHLYKENRRIKKLRVESLDPGISFSVEQELEDVVRFHLIKFPTVAENIRVTILEYYEGTKYKDLCVQAFLTDYDLWLISGESFLSRARPWKP
jgi:hypothetical protein